MCGCEPGFTCSRCTGTPADPRYLLDLEPLTVEEQELREQAEWWMQQSGEVGR